MEGFLTRCLKAYEDVNPFDLFSGKERTELKALAAKRFRTRGERAFFFGFVMAMALRDQKDV